MKKIILLFSTVLLAAGVSAQGSITVDDLSSFRGIQASGNKIELYVTQDAKQPLSMKVELNGNDQNMLKYLVGEGILQIRYTPKNKEKPIVIRLNCHNLETLDLTGVSMTMEGTWQTDMATVTLYSGAKLTAEIYAKDLKVSTQTNATAVIKGGGRYADYETRSKSVLDVRNYNAESTFLRAGGFSECYVYGKERLIIEASDGASVFYRGKPEIFRERTVRGGHTNPIGD